MRIVVAPDSFKGTVNAADAAASIAEGWLAERPQDAARCLPMADGGEGTLDAFLAAVPGAEWTPVRVAGPDGREHDTGWVRLPDGTGVIELAATSGLALMSPLDAARADSLGFGQAIAAALDAGVQRLLLAIGGSASTDGGAGALTALGARLLGTEGEPIPPGNAGLHALVEVDFSALRSLPPGGAVILSDVHSPLLGPLGSAAVFGPQKGADAASVLHLEAGLARLAALMDVDPASPGAGAAGGVGFGLLAWGGRFSSGADAVAELIGLPQAAAEADVVITGEGRFDDQSAAGKAVSSVLRAASTSRTAVALVAGAIEAPTDAFASAQSLSELAGSSREARSNPIPWLRASGASLARILGH